MRVNVVNVCTPNAEEQADIKSALAKIPSHIAFAIDFEVARGRTSSPDAPVSSWVRVRREFAPDLPFVTAQYSFTRDDKDMTETFVLRPRDASEIVQIALEDKVTSGTPAEVFAGDTPATRVRVERLGKASRGITRCSEVDQTAYDALFAQASAIMAHYRKAMGLRTLVPAELARLSAPASETRQKEKGKR